MCTGLSCLSCLRKFYMMPKKVLHDIEMICKAYFLTGEHYRAKGGMWHGLRCVFLNMVVA